MKLSFLTVSIGAGLILSGCAANCTQMGKLNVGISEQEAIDIMARTPSKFSVEGNIRYVFYSCRGEMPDSVLKFADGKLVAYGPEDYIRK